jgi:LPS-assembly protein
VSKLVFASFNFTDSDINIVANSLEYYDNDKVTIANGDVEIIQNNEKLYADKVTYNADQDKIMAYGNVKFYESSGYIIEAEELEITGEFKQAIINNLKLIFPDKSIMLAKSAVKENNNISKIKNADYTPCKYVCGKTSPLWSIQAKNVTIDKQNEKVIYHNAIFKIKKMPVMFLPYFSHPTPNAKKKSGFLTPQFIQNTYLGQSVKTPYYYVISDNQDITITPQFSSLRGVIMHGEHRILKSNGHSHNMINFAKKSTNKNDKEKQSNIHNIRGYLGSNGRYILPQQYIFLHDVNLTTDKTYLKNYAPLNKQGNESNTLTSKIAVNKFEDRNYLLGEMLYFQDLTENKRTLGSAQTALPYIKTENHLLSLPDDSNISLKTNMLSLHNPVNNSYNRASFELLWNKQYAASNGLLFNLSGQIREDVYNYFKTKPEQNKSFVTRFIPKIIIDTSYPLVKYTTNYNLLLEPIVSLVVVPKKNYNKNISNEDSLSTELNDNNVFAHNILSGMDLVEDNYRVSYGMKGNVSSHNNKSLDFLLGQNYSTYNSNTINHNVTSKHNYSDFIGRLNARYHNTVIGYHFTLSKNNLFAKKQAITASQKYKMLTLEIGYIKNNDDILNANGTKNLREIEGKITITKNNDWSLSLQARKNLTSKKDNPNLILHGSRLISTGVHLKKENECIKFETSLTRDYTHMQGKKPSNTLLARVWFKNLT